MSSQTWADAATAKAQLGRVGVWLGALSGTPWTVARAAAQRIEQLGYEALWLSESPAVKEPFTHAALLLGATERIPLATGIANLWVRDAGVARSAALTLADAHPGRFTLGLGVSHRPLVELYGYDYGKPLTAMRKYLDGLDALGWRGAAPAVPVPLVLAALRPKMLELARERTAGAHPYFTPVEHTAGARAALGAEPLLAPEVAIVLETDPSVARERARRYAKLYLALPNYTNNLRDLGYTDEDFADRGSDRLIDAVTPWGDEATIAARIGEQFAAGADHVCVQPVGVDVPTAVDELERLAPALLG
jgi:probable F420-dependent oxidoreductase